MPPTRRRRCSRRSPDLAAADDRVVRRATETVATSAPIAKTTLDHTLGEGMAGDDVERLQERLTAAGVRPRSRRRQLRQPDAAGGVGLREAGAWACRGREATGQVTPEMWSMMQDPIQVAPRRAGGLVRSRRDLPARAGDGDLPRRRAGAGGAHVERASRTPTARRSSTARTSRSTPTRSATRLPEPITKPIKGLAKTPPGVFQRRPRGRRRAQRPARHDVGPGVHQPGHRHPRRQQRAARAGVARLHPGLALPRPDRPGPDRQGRRGADLGRQEGARAADRPRTAR